MKEDKTQAGQTVPLNSLVGLPAGSRIWFSEEKRPYRVRATGKRFLICAKPFNPKRTVLYTVVDTQDGIRGTENLIFGMGAETTEDCSEMLQRLEEGETAISRRNFISLNVVRIEKANN